MGCRAEGWPGCLGSGESPGRGEAGRPGREAVVKAWGGPGPGHQPGWILGGIRAQFGNHRSARERQRPGVWLGE